MSTKIIPSSFAPGADAGMLTARAAAGVEPCPGCRRTPLAECAGGGGDPARRGAFVAALHEVLLGRSAEHRRSAQRSRSTEPGEAATATEEETYKKATSRLMSTASSYRDSTRSGSSSLRIIRFAAALGGWHLKFVADDRGDFTAAVESVRDLPPESRRWDASAGCWWISYSGAQRLGELLPAVGSQLANWSPPTVAQLRRAKPKTTIVPLLTADVRAAFDILYLQTSAPASVIRASRKALAHGMHPDAGGAPIPIAKLNQAQARALEWARKRHQQGDYDPPPDAA